MICSGVMLAGGVGSSGPKPAASCAAAPYGIATAAMAGVGRADSRRDRTLAETRLRVAEARARAGFMLGNSMGGAGCFCLACVALHATKNRRDLGGLVMWPGAREMSGLIVLRWLELSLAGGGLVGALVPGAGWGGGGQTGEAGAGGTARLCRAGCSAWGGCGAA